MAAGRWLAIGTALFTLAVAASPAEAQHISFSFGHYHGHHHRHHCWHDPFWCGPHWDYVYVAPPPVVRRHVTYVQPAEQVVETQVVLPPRVSATPRATSTSTRTAESPLQIWNSAGQRVPVAFLVDSQETELHDGQSHTFYGSGPRTVSFDRGGNFGTARYQLSGGEYEFVITAQGWDLVRKQEADSVALQPLVKKNSLPGDTLKR